MKCLSTPLTHSSCRRFGLLMAVLCKSWIVRTRFPCRSIRRMLSLPREMSLNARCAFVMLVGTHRYGPSHPSTPFATAQVCTCPASHVGSKVTLHRDVGSNTFTCPCGEYSSPMTSIIQRHAKNVHQNMTKAISAAQVPKPAVARKAAEDAMVRASHTRAIHVLTSETRSIA